MANSYSSLFYHIVFSTKNRKKWIKPDIENRVWKYIGGIARKHKCTAIRVGGIEDHIHTLILSPPKLAPSQIAQFIKGDSSKWIHEEFQNMKTFGWQDGYSVFSVRKSIVPKVVDYIKNQRRHHEGKSFETEYKDLLHWHEIDPVEERYIFG
jgi:REP element-mobilizing transposase RayT